MTNKSLRSLFDNPFPTLFPVELFKAMDKFFVDLEEFDVNDLRLSLRGHPSGDLYTNKDGNLVLKLALAGYNKDNLSVNVDGNKLVIAASKTDDDDDAPSSIAKRAFKKVFTDFAGCWALEIADVSYKEGLLKIVIPPKQKKNTSKLLEIK